MLVMANLACETSSPLSPENYVRTTINPDTLIDSIILTQPGEEVGSWNFPDEIMEWHGYGEYVKEIIIDI